MCAVLLLLAALGQFGLYRCPVQTLTGVQCPGCGMTRAAMSLLRLDFKGAAAHNLMVLPAAVYSLLMLWAWAAGKRMILRSRLLWGLFIGMLLAGWVIRLLLFLKGSNPAFFSEGGLLAHIFQIWQGGG